MTLILPETATPWVPNMVFRARRNKDTPKTLCEHFVEEQVVTFIRAYFPMGGPNFDYGPVMERATRFVMYIDLLCDNLNFRNAFLSMLQNQTTTDSMVAAVFQDRELVNLLKVLSDVQWSRSNRLAASRAYKLSFYAWDPAMVDQLIWGFTHRDDAHSGVRSDLDSDLFIIIVLLIRHFKYYGGLVLPPMQAARVKQATHEALVDSEKALNRSTELLFMHYPNWRDSQGLIRPPGLGGPSRALAVVPNLRSNLPSDRPTSEHLSSAGPSRFGAVGENRARREVFNVGRRMRNHEESRCGSKMKTKTA